MTTTIQTILEHLRVAEEARQAEAEKEDEYRRAAAMGHIDAARAVLGTLADEAEVALTGWLHEPTFAVAPREWHGLVIFDIRRHSGTAWTVRFPQRPQSRYTLNEAADWYGPLAEYVAEMQAFYENRRDDEIAYASEGLRDADTLYDAMDHHANLMRVAPQRAAEWDAALEAWRAESARKDAAAVERARAFDDYIAALAAWRAEYEAALAANRAAVGRIQAELAATDDGREQAEVVQHDGYAMLAVIRRHITHVDDAGMSLSYWPDEMYDVKRRLEEEIVPLPEQPDLRTFGAFGGLTDAERRRIDETVGDMQIAGVPF